MERWGNVSMGDEEEAEAEKEAERQCVRERDIFQKI